MKVPCPDCNRFSGTPGFVWSHQKLIPCRYCNGEGFMIYPRSYLMAPTKDAPTGTRATLIFERKEGDYDPEHMDERKVRSMLKELSRYL